MKMRIAMPDKLPVIGVYTNLALEWFLNTPDGNRGIVQIQPTAARKRS
jgi:hypothetical protein